jgi:preprotein translocase subunit SecE
MNPKSHQVSMEVASELMRVTWPSWEETRVSTFAVVAASIIAGVLLFFIDSFSYKLMVDWLPHMWGKL